MQRSSRGGWSRVLDGHACVLVLIAAVGAALADTLTVEGVGATRGSAIAAALRNAVERRVGVSIGAESLVDNHVLVSDKILSRTEGYVRSYEVRGTSTTLGLVRVRVTADVAEGKLRDDLVAQQLLYEIKNRPRIMVLLDERVEGGEMFEKTATHVLEQDLLERGFKLVEREQLEKVKEVERLKGLADPELASLGFRTGADLIVRGKISVGASTPKMVYDVKFFTVPVQLNARVVRADNAQILVTRTARTKKNSREEFSAAQAGLEAGAHALAGELIDALNEFWRSEAYNRNEIELVVSGAAGPELRRIEKMLRSLPFVRDISLRFLEGESALYDLRIMGTVQDLRFAFDKENLPGLAVTSLTANRLAVAPSAPGAGISFAEEKPALEIDAFTIEDIFPSRARYYEHNPLGRVKIRCTRGRVHDLHISVRMPEIMSLPGEAQLEGIAPGAEKTVALNLLPVQEKLLATTETRTINGQVKISWGEASSARERTLTAPATVYSKNAMDWAVPDALGGFVTFNAPSVRNLARRAVRAVPEDDMDNTDLLNAAALFESMRILGISYVRDPIPSGSMVLDMVQYPAETLELRSGDCDDLSVLYAALLSAVGIPAAVISYHDHVLVMFDTGIYRKNRATLSADTALSVVHNATVWIPVETTALDKGFHAAWRIAAGEFHTALAEGQGISIVELEEAWKSYPPVAFEKKAGDPDLEGLAGAVGEQRKLIEEAAGQSMASAAERLKSKSSLSTLGPVFVHNRLGILAAGRGEYPRALSRFEEAGKQTGDPRIGNNYACALLLTGREQKARELLDSLYRKDPAGRIAVNRALSYYVGADDRGGVDRFVEALREAVRMMPSGKGLSEYLGIDLDEPTKLRAGEEHVGEKPQTVNIRRLKELIRRRVLSGGGGSSGTSTGPASPSGPREDVSGTTSETSTGQSAEESLPAVMPFGGIRGADPEQVEKVRDLLYWIEIEEDRQ